MQILLVLKKKEEKQKITIANEIFKTFPQNKASKKTELTEF